MASNQQVMIAQKIVASGGSGPVIDASSPIVVVGVGVAEGTGITTAAFNPPANSLLVLVIECATGGSTTPAFTISNNGSALDAAWALAAKSDRSVTTKQGAAHVWYGSIVASRTGMTVTGKITAASSGYGGTFDQYLGMKLFVITGANASPIGATGANTVSTNDVTNQTVYTSTVNNSLGIGGMVQMTNTNPAVLTSTDTIYNIGVQFATVGSAINKTAVTTPSGSTVTMTTTIDLAGTFDWNWVAVEIKP